MAKKRDSVELWDRLDNETARAYEAFKVFMQIHPAERKPKAAWKIWTDNPEARRTSPFFLDWYNDFAWEERARARDMALDAARRRGEEKAIEREAEKQAASSEKTRNRFNELMAMGYEAAMRSLEEAASEGSMGVREAIQVVKLHFDATREFATGAQGDGDDWTEEDDAEFVDEVVAEIQSGGAGSPPEEDGPGEEEEGL